MKKKKTLSAISAVTLCCLLAVQGVQAEGNTIGIAHTAGEGSFPVVAGGQAAQLVVDAQDVEVERTLRCLPCCQTPAIV
ncbi:MAG: hypothetical protein LBH84_01710 [Prevotellaceae bacterium]|nr:hypothetical protein [Prevotellaceae bacterium]